MKITILQANVEEGCEATMACFLSGLRLEIANVVKLQHYVKMSDMLEKTIFKLSMNCMNS